MIAIVKYNAGNISSVKTALERLGEDVIITDDPKILNAAEKVIFPGVGEASSAMSYLKERGLDETIKNLRQPVLGVCLGLQLLCNWSEEGDTKCLGIFENKVQKFPPKDIVPHMGWNSFESISENPLLKSINQSDDMYYVHSYFAEISPDTIATCGYINEFSAVLQKDNFYATQFHPEKSGEIGQIILKNFIEL